MLNLPNSISLFRVLSAPVLWILIYKGEAEAFKWLISVAFATDMVDGYLARKLKQVTKLGSILDSYGDSLTILSGLAGLYFFQYEYIAPYIQSGIMVLSLHFLQLAFSLIKFRKPSSFHTKSAKLAALAIGVFILFTLHFRFSEPLFYLTMVLLSIDAIEESILVFMLPSWQTDVKGIYWVLKSRKKN